MPNTYFTSSNNTNMSYNSTDGYAIKKPHSTSPDLPDITFNGWDDQGNSVIMKLSPEGGIPSADVMKLLMLTIATLAGNSGTNALAYVKKHNLERHFTYS